MSASGAGKEQRQKRIAIAGAIVLLAVLAFQGPRTLKLLRGSPPPVSEELATQPVPVAAPSPLSAAGPTASRPSRARIARFPLKDPFVSAAGAPVLSAASAGTAASPGPSLLSGSGRSYDESRLVAFSPGPSVLSGVAAAAPVEPAVEVPDEGAAGTGSAARYTVILSSIPISAGRRAADREARAFRRAGLPKVGILVSSRYRSLRSGYYVVYSGSYATAAAAQRAAVQARPQARTAHSERLRLADAGL